MTGRWTVSRKNKRENVEVCTNHTRHASSMFQLYVNPARQNGDFGRKFPPISAVCMRNLGGKLKYGTPSSIVQGHFAVFPTILRILPILHSFSYFSHLKWHPHPCFSIISAVSVRKNSSMVPHLLFFDHMFTDSTHILPIFHSLVLSCREWLDNVMHT